MRRVVELTLAAVMGALVSGAGAWVTLGRSVDACTTPPEVIDLIEAHSPYVRDQRVLNDALEQIRMLADGQQLMREELAVIKSMLRRGVP